MFDILVSYLFIRIVLEIIYYVIWIKWIVLKIGFCKCFSFVDVGFFKFRFLVFIFGYV